MGSMWKSEGFIHLVKSTPYIQNMFHKYLDLILTICYKK